YLLIFYCYECLKLVIFSLVLLYCMSILFSVIFVLLFLFLLFLFFFSFFFLYYCFYFFFYFFFSSRRRHTRLQGDWSSDVCSSDLIHWYGIFYAVAFFVAYQFGVLPLAIRKGIPRAIAEKITVWTIIFGLLGARLYYDVQQPNLGQFISNPINLIAFWQGGMAFFGAIIGGFITLAVCAWRYRINPWLVLDGGVIFAVIGQPIGRIGNLINGDILGAQSNAPWATRYTFQTPPGSGHCAVLQVQAGFQCGVAYQPAAAYEALGTIVIGLVLVWLLRRGVRDGLM